jgi:pimeloyl-ACP methyl ester carboxylesterase
VANVKCPVLVIHGEQDWIVPIAHARHTASLVQGAQLRTYAEHGHLSVGAEAVAGLVDLKARAEIGFQP